MSIYLIRHAQSKFNAVFKNDFVDPMIFDAPLSELGKEQAIEAREKISELKIEKLIVSPLTRTLETAEFMFERNLPISINPLVREQLSYSGDVGTKPKYLARDWDHLDFDHLDDPWWYDGERNYHGFAVEPLASLEKRAETFVEWARSTRLHSTAIVSHGNFIRVLTGIQPDNCQIIKFEI